MFGLEQGQQLDDLRDALTGVLAFSESPLSVLPAMQRLAGGWFPPLKRFIAQTQRADALIFDLIDERRAEGDQGRDDVLSMLLQARHEDGSPMAPQELRDELMTALVAGHETTASQLAWGFERLARRDAGRAAADRRDRRRRRGRVPDRDDQRDPAAQAGAAQRRAAADQAPGSDRRLRVPGRGRAARERLPRPSRPGDLPEPYAFSPERFLGVSPGTYTWIPFGGGRRRCLGASFALQEMKIVIRAVLRRFSLSAAGAKPEQTGRRSITFSPAGRATVILHERQRAAVDRADAALATA